MQPASCEWNTGPGPVSDAPFCLGDQFWGGTKASATPALVQQEDQDVADLVRGYRCAWRLWINKQNNNVKHQQQNKTKQQRKTSTAKQNKTTTKNNDKTTTQQQQ